MNSLFKLKESAEAAYYRNMGKAAPEIVVSLAELKTICRLPISDFHAYGEKVKTKDGGLYFYKDNGPESKILLVAHLDSVQEFHWGGHLVTKSGDTKIYCTTLDDRAGAYAILRVLSKIEGLKFDILLTTGEEKSESTAAFFQAKKQYNWIASFDKSGIRNTVYSYTTNRQWRTALEEQGILLSSGSYSDVCSMAHLETCAVNFGIGFDSYHYEDASLSLNQFKSQLKKFIRFYNVYSDQRFEHIPAYNIVSKDGFSYSYYVSKGETFNAEEFAYAKQLLFEMKENPNKEIEFIPGIKGSRLTIDQVRFAMANQGKSEKGKTANILVLPTKEEIVDYSKKTITAEKKPVEGKIKVQDLDKMAIAVVHTHPEGETAEEIANEAKEKGYNAIISRKCIDCGSYFVSNRSSLCPVCESKLINSQKEQVTLKSDPLPLTEPVKKKEVLSKYQTMAKNYLTMLRLPIGSSVPLSRRLSIILKVLRTSAISEEKAKVIYSWLVKEKLMYPYQIPVKKGTDDTRIVRKGNREYLAQDWPPMERIELTHQAAMFLFKLEGSFEFEKACRIIQGGDFKKWISRLEQGRSDYFGSNIDNRTGASLGKSKEAVEGQFTLVKEYASVFASYVHEEFKEVIEEISKLTSDMLNPEKEPEEKKKFKFRADKAGNPVSYTLKRNKPGQFNLVKSSDDTEYKWAQVVTAAVATE